VGRVHSLTYAAGAVILKAAEALERSFEHRGQADLREAANIAAEIEIAQAQTTISALVLEATSALFDALGASATSVSKSFDQYWRNARTVTSHNPRIYKDRIVGDFVVNGTPPPFQWRIDRRSLTGDPRGALACPEQRGELRKEPFMDIGAALFDSCIAAPIKILVIEA
jgi:hypothetical protein